MLNRPTKLVFLDQTIPLFCRGHFSPIQTASFRPLRRSFIPTDLIHDYPHKKSPFPKAFNAPLKTNKLIPLTPIKRKNLSEKSVGFILI